MSICEDCSNKRDTWSDELKEQGYIGCIIGLMESKLISDIDTETVATGWIKAGGSGRCFNGQIITRGTRSCPHKNSNCGRYDHIKDDDFRGPAKRPAGGVK